jgi:hypothetical protein
MIDLRGVWSDAVLPALSSKTRALFSGVPVSAAGDGEITFAFSSDVHRQRCDGVRDELEQAFRTHTGGAVAVRLVDEGAAPVAAIASASAPPPAPAPEAPAEPAPSRATKATPVADYDDEVIDITELEDAPAAGTLLDQLKTAFPGAQIIEE